MIGLKLDGIHHITCITSDGPRNAEFYVGLLGLRLVKKTVNFDMPEAYHLYYGDEGGSPGGILTFFEFPGVERGRAGAGMIHRLLWRVRSAASLAHWRERLSSNGIEPSGNHASLRFQDPEGLWHELVIDDSGDPPLTADAEGIPAERRIEGFEGVRALHREPASSEELLVRTLGFEGGGDHGYGLRGETRSASYSYDEASGSPGLQGAGTVHHIAWACRPDDQPAWQQRVRDAGAGVTDILDRKYFTSIYFREPSGVLFEIATIGPGFAVDEPAESLGEALKLPEWHEHLRPRLERTLRAIEPIRPGAGSRRSA
ncbi:MAG: VOC family protein [Actinomycetota bacterium]